MFAEVMTVPKGTAGSEMELLVLAVLARAPAHGYAIAREINRRADGALSMKEGTLYPLLHGMEADGLVKAAWRESERGPARRTYELRGKGRRTLAKQARAWRRRVGAVERVLEGSSSA